MIDVREHGATGSGTSDDTAAIQRAIDTAAAAGGGIVYFPPGTYKTASVLRIDGDGITLRGCGAIASKIFNASSDVMKIADSAGTRFFRLEELMVESSYGGGHILTFGRSVSHSRFSGVYLNQQNAGKSCLYGHFSNYGIYDTLFKGCIFEGAYQHTVPLVDIETTIAVFNTNTFDRCRFQGNGSPQAYQFQLICTGNQWNIGNTLRDINFEVADAGAIFCEGASATLLENIGFYDLTTTTADLVYLGKNSAQGALNTRYTTMINIQRIGGTLGAGLYDLLLSDAAYTTIINCGRFNAVGEFSLNDQWCVLFNCYANLGGYTSGTASVVNATHMLAPTLRVGNSANGTTVGDCQKKIEVFDEGGSSIGFLAVYDGIE